MEIKLDSTGNVFLVTESVDPEKLKDTLDFWNPEYALTPKLVKMMREIKRRLPEFIGDIEKEVQAI